MPDMACVYDPFYYEENERDDTVTGYKIVVQAKCSCPRVFCDAEVQEYHYTMHPLSRDKDHEIYDQMREKYCELRESDSVIEIYKKSPIVGHPLAPKGKEALNFIAYPDEACEFEPILNDPCNCLKRLRGTDYFPSTVEYFRFYPTLEEDEMMFKFW